MRTRDEDSLVDAITVEVIQNALVSLIREMRGTIIRTAFGPLIWEVHDFSCGLLAPDGELIAISEDNPIHIVPTIFCVPEIQKRFGDRIYEGDVFMINDPYILGTHMNDVAHLHPVFVDGRLTFWTVVRVHYTDIGGMAAGSITPDARNVFQEGIRIPPVKVYERGQPNDSFLDVLFANIRGADERRGDLMAVIGAFWTADKRLREVVGRFTPDELSDSLRIANSRAEKRMRLAIGALPETESAFELNLDTDGTSAAWVPIRVRVTVAHSPRPALRIDFSESSPAVRGPMNGSPVSAACAAFTASKSFLDPGGLVNGGSFRPIEIVTRPGTIFDAPKPSPMCGAADLGGYRAVEAVMGALAAFRPEAGVGDHSSPIHSYFSGWDSDSVFYELLLGGTGAVLGADGSDVMAGFERGDFPRVSSVEVYEREIPFLAVANELITDSGGAGEFRGGLGMRRSWKFLGQAGAVTDMSEPSLTPNYGMAGGFGGMPSTCRVLRHDTTLYPAAVSGTGKATRFPIVQDDVIELFRWGGGGYGDPLGRDPRLVEADVNAGLVSSEVAHSAYGVAFADGRVDDDATAQRRAALLRSRVVVRVLAAESDALVSGTRQIDLSAESADRLGVQAGDVIECVTADTAAIRARCRVRSDAPTGSISLGPFARLALRLSPGAPVWIRRADAYVPQFFPRDLWKRMNNPTGDKE